MKWKRAKEGSYYIDKLIVHKDYESWFLYYKGVYIGLYKSACEAKIAGEKLLCTGKI